MATQAISTVMKSALLILNIILLAIGNCGTPLILRLYYIHGGQRIWFSSWLQTGGWPIILLPITIAYLHRKNTSSPQTEFFLMKPPVFFAAAFIGIITGFDNYLYASGLARLPASTASLIVGSQLAFTACFAFLLVKQKFTPYSINAVFLLTIGAGILALRANSDRPENETTKEYVKGFVMTIGASILYGLTLPLVELTYKKARQQITYGLVLEIQMVMCFFATVFCTVGMLVNRDFQAIRREATVFGLGEARYYLVVVMTAIVSQGFFLGAIGVIFCGSSLLSAVVIAATLPITQILAVIFFKENFQAEKGVSLALSLWGFGSYFYGEIKHSKKQKQKETLEAEKQLPETELPQQTLDP